MRASFDPTHVFHYGTSVLDMDESVARWKKIGAEVLMPPVEGKDVNVICCIMLYNDAVIELVAPANEEGRKQMEPLFLRPGAIDHIAYFSNDVAGDLKALESDGGQVQLPVTYHTGYDRNMAFILMPTGLIIELMDRRATGKRSADPLDTFNAVVSSKLRT